MVNTPFPPDDASVGYERGVSVSPAWEEATTHAAIEFAHQVVRRLDTLARVGGSGENRDEKILRFCRQLVETAFRRPLTAEQARFFVQDQFDAAATRTPFGSRKGNSHTLHDIPFVLIGNGLGFSMGRSLRFDKAAHNRLYLTLAHAVGHRLDTFGKPELCEGGPLDLSSTKT